MSSTATDTTHKTGDEAETLTDGFHLVIDALKLNGINNVYGVPGIPITDLGRYMQAEGLRVLSLPSPTELLPAIDGSPVLAKVQALLQGLPRMSST